MAIRTYAALLLGATMSMSAYGHQLWLEPAGKAVDLHFGEFDENLKEVSPGRLDRIPQPMALQGAKRLEASKTANAYRFMPADSAEALTVEVTDYPVREKKEGERTLRSKWVPAARYIPGFAAVAPRNTLDIVPLGETGKFRVYFREQPLAKKAVTLVAPNGWTRTATSDDKGELELKPLWKGTYVIELKHESREALPSDGSYDSVSYTSTLTFVQPRGPATTRPAPVQAKAE